MSRNSSRNALPPARRLVNARFDGVPYHTAITGSPILADSLAWYDCRVEAMHDGGDHTIFIGRVEAVGFGAEGKQPLVYFANRYAASKGLTAYGHFGACASYAAAFTVTPLNSMQLSSRGSAGIK